MQRNVQPIEATSGVLKQKKTAVAAALYAARTRLVSNACSRLAAATGARRIRRPDGNLRERQSGFPVAGSLTDCGSRKPVHFIAKCMGFSLPVFEGWAPLYLSAGFCSKNRELMTNDGVVSRARVKKSRSGTKSLPLGLTILERRYSCRSIQFRAAVF